MYTPKIKVYSLDILGNDVQHFWIGDLAVLLDHPLMQQPHKNDFYMFLFTDTASGRLQIDSDEIHLDEAKITIIKPGCVNSVELEEKPLGKAICFSEAFFSLRYNNNILNHFSLFQEEHRFVATVSDEQSGRLKNLLQMAEDEFSRKLSHNLKVLRSYVNIILFEMERLLLADSSTPKNDVNSEKIQQFKKLIEQHYISNKLPSYYADNMNISVNYLNRLCKEKINLTAGGVIRKHIGLEAQRFLSFTTLTINEIAIELGFESSSYFITFFKKQIGITPEQFRKKQ